ncbi:MAG: heme-binding domain-containing protein [Opitutaceae bacterium]
MKNRFRLAAVVLAVLLIGIQFLHPERNLGITGGPNDIAVRFVVPDNVHAVLTKACYDCHSNYTRYPWYAGVQPVAWWMSHHVHEAKRELNFSEFGSYSVKRTARKLDAIVDEVERGDMPLISYTWMHPEARLTAAQRKLLTDWAQALHDQIVPE